MAADLAAKSGAAEALIAQPHQVTNVWQDKKVFEGECGLAKKVAKEIADMRKLGLLTTHALPSAADVHDGQVRPDHPTLFSSGPGGAVGASLVKRASEVRASPAGLTTEAALGFAYGLP